MVLLPAEPLFSPEAMAAVDRAAIASGLDGFALMQRAGAAVAALVLRHYPAARRIAVFCGPGNNGGDGYVAARALLAAGMPTAIYHLGDPEQLRGDARSARTHCPCRSLALADYRPRNGDVIVDAIFGAGLTRDLPEAVRSVIEQVAAAGLPVVAVDLPSGIDGRSGQARPVAFRADHSITFMALKPGHVLLPGREACGSIAVFDIGIPKRILAAHVEDVGLNRPADWERELVSPSASTHKFNRGHLTVFSGPGHASGAARLSAMAGLKAGAGLVTVAAPADALAVNAMALTAIMVKPVEDEVALGAYLADRRPGAFVLGPGFGVGERVRRFAEALAGHPLVLDADGITAFASDPQRLFRAFAGEPTRLVLTPHAGEFGRLFPDLDQASLPSKVDRARAAAARSRAIVVFKGADTVIASPEGRVRINDNAPSWLATAGSGDVLAGIIGALLARGLPPFEAAAAGAWLHGEAGRRAGEGMTAEDLLHPIAGVLAAISA